MRVEISNITVNDFQQEFLSYIQTRLKALDKLSGEGIDTWVFFGPILPFVSDDYESIQNLIESCKPHASHILVDRMNLYSRVFYRLKKMLSKEFPDLLPKYQELMRDSMSYEKELKERIEIIAAREKVKVEYCF